MRKNTLYGMCLLAAVLWGSTATAAWAHRVGVGLHIGLGVPLGISYPYYSSYPVFAPWWYTSGLYALPPVVYATPPVVASVPGVVPSAPSPAATASLQLLVAPLQADIYLNGRYIGRAEEFPEGQVRLHVSPGNHTVEFRFGIITHTHRVTVEAGGTAVLHDRLS